MSFQPLPAVGGGSSSLGSGSSSSDTFLQPGPKKKRNAKGLKLAPQALEPALGIAGTDESVEMHLQDTQRAALLFAATRGRQSDDDLAATLSNLTGSDPLLTPRDRHSHHHLNDGESDQRGSSSSQSINKRAGMIGGSSVNGLTSQMRDLLLQTSGEQTPDLQGSDPRTSLLDELQSENTAVGEVSRARDGNHSFVRSANGSDHNAVLPSDTKSGSGNNNASTSSSSSTSAGVKKSSAKSSRTSRSRASASTEGSSSMASVNSKMDLKNDEFKVLGDLGAGNGGTVMRVLHIKSGLTMARKLVLIDAKPSVRKQIIRELQIMHDCQSPWIVSFYGAFLSDPHICICMEYMDRGSLDTIYKRHGAIDIPIVGKIAEAVLEGLTYLYDVHRIIHRDIKPSNIVVNSSGEIKLCDFGVSGELINSIANTFVGTSTYMSPERIQGGNYSVKSDVWSLGISLIELVLGRFPFSDDAVDSDDDSDLRAMQETAASATIRPDGSQGPPHLQDRSRVTESAKRERRKSKGVSLAGGGMTMSILDLLQHIVNEPAPTLSPPGKYPPAAESFIADCLQKDPAERHTPKQLLAHEWITQVKKSDVDLKAWAEALKPAHE